MPAVQLSDGNLTTRILPGRDETLVRQCFLSDGNISWISGLDVRLVIMRTKDLNQYITSVFAYNSTRVTTKARGWASYSIHKTAFDLSWRRRKRVSPQQGFKS